MYINYFRTGFKNRFDGLGLHQAHCTLKIFHVEVEALNLKVGRSSLMLLEAENKLLFKVKAYHSMSVCVIFSSKCHKQRCQI